MWSARGPPPIGVLNKTTGGFMGTELHLKWKGMTEEGENEKSCTIEIDAPLNEALEILRQRIERITQEHFSRDREASS
jgi:hypothetical protein